MPYTHSSQPHKRKAASSTQRGSNQSQTEQPQPLPDIYQRITDQIIRAIEAGAGDWQMPWHTNKANGGMMLRPINAASSKPYRGVNVLALWIAADANGYQSREWATYKQWAERGAQVRKGEKSTSIVFWKIGDKESSEDTTEGDNPEQQTERRLIIARGYAVFNADQVDGYTPKVEEQPAALLPDPLPRAQRIDHIEQFFAAIGADIRHGGNRAFYRPASDHIQMPPFEAFHDPIAYYATLGHEAAHWTGVKHRLDRDLSGRFGNEAYAAEELIAELSAAFLSADLELTNKPRPDHAAYVANWLKVLKNDNRAIFTAAAKAQQAVDYLHALQAAAPEPNLATVPATVSLPVNASGQFHLDL